VSELRGQMDLDELLKGTGNRGIEGYDAEGNLINPQTGEREEGNRQEATGNSQDAGETTAETTGESADVNYGVPTVAGDWSEIAPASASRLSAIAAEVRAIEEQVRDAALSGALKVGRRLIEAKGLVPRGRWGEWLKLNVSYSERRAQDLMRLFEVYGREGIPASVSELDYSKAVALLSAPEEVREDLAEQAAEMSVRQLQEEIKRMKADRESDQLKLDSLMDAHERAEAANRALMKEHEAVEQAQARAKAAEETAEEMRKVSSRAADEASKAAARASDAVQRANETQAKLNEAKERISELEAREPERVEVLPADVAAELERLRNEKPRSEAVARLRMGYERLVGEFKAVRELLATVAQEDGEVGGRYATAIRRACEKMAEEMGE